MARKSLAHSTPIRNGVLLIVLAICCVVVVIVAIPPMSNPSIAMNHVLAAHSALELIAVEHQHAVRFPAAGFTCDLRQPATDASSQDRARSLLLQPLILHSPDRNRNRSGSHARKGFMQSTG